MNVSMVVSAKRKAGVAGDMVAAAPQDGSRFPRVRLPGYSSRASPIFIASVKPLSGLIFEWQIVERHYGTGNTSHLLPVLPRKLRDVGRCRKRQSEGRSGRSR